MKLIDPLKKDADSLVDSWAMGYAPVVCGHTHLMWPRAVMGRDRRSINFWRLPGPTMQEYRGFPRMKKLLKLRRAGKTCV